jgi:hypothetical protein
MPVIIATQEAGIRRIAVLSKPGQIVRETLSWKTLHTKNRAGGVAPGVGPEFKPQYYKKKKKIINYCNFSFFESGSCYIAEAVVELAICILGWS